MDTALFYLSYLGLSPAQARTVLNRMINNAVQFGGCLTINWHDRSLFPERLWETCYRDLVQDLKTRGAWFSTAGQAVTWFKKRRAALFEVNRAGHDAIGAKITTNDGDDLPGLQLRIHRSRDSREIGTKSPAPFVDIAFDESVGTRVPCGLAG